VDRLLDGEVPAAERQAREADLARDGALRARVGRRRAFLAALAAAGARARAARRPSALLEARVRSALRRPPARTLWLRGTAAAALLAAVGTAFLLGRSDPAEALPEEVRAAVALIAHPAGAPAGAACAEGRSTSPTQFPAVRERALTVGACVEPEAEEGGGTQALLLRVEDLTPLGYVAVPDEGARPGPEIGATEFADAVVFDLAYGRTRYYLAVPKSFLETKTACAACHGPDRAGAPNPHRIVKRRWER
jgi:anti-sigma factor RsiW